MVFNYRLAPARSLVWVHTHVVTPTWPRPLKGKLLSPPVDCDSQHNQLRGDQRSKSRLIPMLSLCASEMKVLFHALDTPTATPTVVLDLIVG